MDKSELLNQLRIDRGTDEDAAPSRIRIWIGIALALALAGAAIFWLLGRGETTEVVVASARALPAVGGGGSVLDATGYVTARRQATVSAKITGKVRTLHDIPRAFGVHENLAIRIGAANLLALLHIE